MTGVAKAVDKRVGMTVCVESGKVRDSNNAFETRSGSADGTGMKALLEMAGAGDGQATSRLARHG